MLKSSALYLVLVISLIVSITIGSMIYLASFFRQQDAKFKRYNMLSRQLEAAYQLGSSCYFPFVQDSVLRNTLTQGDSVLISRFQWGLYDILSVKTAIQNDSLQYATLLGLQAKDTTVLYVVDEDRPISVSGETIIKGNTFLPKSGIRPSYVDGNYYKGYKDIVEGRQKNSNRNMPPYEEMRMQSIQNLLKFDSIPYPLLPNGNLSNSFLNRTQIYNASKVDFLTDSITGNLMIISDTTVHIASSSYLDDVIIIAPCIRIEKGFVGQLQLFAQDSIIIENQVHLQYPSTLGLLKEKDQQSKIRIGDRCKIAGTVFLYEKERSNIPSVASCGLDCTIEGDISIAGLLDYKKGLKVFGSISCYRFLYKSSSSLYENFLVNVNFDYTKRSPFYLNSFIKKLDKNRLSHQPIKWYHEI